MRSTADRRPDGVQPVHWQPLLHRLDRLRGQGSEEETTTMKRAFLISMVLVDVPFMLFAVAVGWRDPVATAAAWYGWRQAHPWTWAVSLPAAALVARRLWLRRTPSL
jgi:hypothetical protein